MGSLDGKVAIVTGAGQGIGRGVALALAKAGASVALLGRTLEKLRAVEREIQECGGTALSMACDAGQREQVDAALAAIMERFGPVFIMVNNAISIRHAPINEATDSELDEVLRTGVYASLYFMQACFPTMKRQGGGRIFNFGSGAGTMGLEGTGAYSIAKEGLRGLTKVAAVEWGKFNITVNTICPAVLTPLYEERLKDLTSEERAAQMALYPMGGPCDAERDVGGLIVFLSGPGGGRITSRTLHVDGGRAYYDR